MKQTPEEFACSIWGTDVGGDHSFFKIPLSAAIGMIQTYINLEAENLPISRVNESTLLLPTQVALLRETLNELMHWFDSEEDKIDFILDICNAYIFKTTGVFKLIYIKFYKLTAYVNHL